jgi:hypothetical protein
MTKLVHILATLSLVTFALLVFADNKADVDLWGNVGFVRALPWQDGYHYTNTYSYTEKESAWINHEWGAEYLLYGAHALAGNRGLLALKVLLGFALLAIMHAAMRRAGVSGAVRYLLLLLILSTIGYGFSTRPHLFTYVLYASFVYILMFRPMSSIATCIVLPLLGWIWANLHGAYFIGILLLLIHGVFSLRGPSATHGVPARDAFISAGAFIALTFVNPYGPHLWEFMFQSAAKMRPYLSEWGPFNPAQHFYEHVDFIVLVLVSSVALIFSPAPRGLRWLILLVLWLAAGLSMRRNIPLFAITAGFVVAPHVERLAGASLQRITRQIPRGLLAALMAVFMFGSAWTAWTKNKVDPLEIEIDQDRFPTAVIQFLKMNDVAGNALVFFDWAEYAIWHLHPACHVFLDGRYRSAYGVQSIEDYFNFLYLGPDWARAIDDYPTDLVVIHRGNPVYRRMLEREDWIAIFGDSIATLFVKASRHAALIRAVETETALLPPEIRTAHFP